MFVNPNKLIPFNASGKARLQIFDDALQYIPIN